MPINTLSLFSGAGGLDIGFTKAGFKIIACIEVDKIACKTLELNKGKYFENSCRIILENIRNLDPAKLELGKIDFIIGGPPCQSFSAAGRRAGGVLGTADSRGALFSHYCDFIKYFQPQGFLFENVRGILYSNKGNDWKQVLSAFSGLGYETSYRLLDCADYGVPQHRERLILVGSKEKRIRFPWPTHGPDSPLGKYVSALEAIRDLQPLDEPKHNYDGKYAKLLAMIPPGMNYRYFTKELGCPNPVFAWRSRFSHFLYKADPDKPVQTIVARQSKFCGPFHWKNRRFTIEELKRLQTFPDDYLFVDGYTRILYQIGNSVPPKFAEQSARAVIQQLFGIDWGIKLLPPDHILSFDKQKGRKARRTRKLHVSASARFSAPSLSSFQSIAESREGISLAKESVDGARTVFYEYLSPNKRIESYGKKQYKQSSLFRVTENRSEGKCEITVSKWVDGDFLSAPIIGYKLTFRHPIGNGLSEISSILASNDDGDIMVLWDAVELCVTSNSNYLSLMDIFGHFTEPHPIFDLKCKLYQHNMNTFLVNFSEYFSDFSKIAKVFPESVLEEIWAKGTETDSFNFLAVVKRLRSLRFDIRVYETNRTIPPGMFKVCYPFTLQYNKPIAVTWKEQISDNNDDKGKPHIRRSA
jgi:DNA (cytosine-5)-methyltransferase 1